MIKCKLCGRKFKVVSSTHLKMSHKTTIAAYSKEFGHSGVGFVFNVTHLQKSDLRYMRWRNSLIGRQTGWAKGFTKYTHPGLKKISDTFKKNKIDNFASWRERALREGIMSDFFKPLKKDKELSFLIGLVLGDGHIQKFPRTQGLTIALGTDKPRLWKYAARVVDRVFRKKPYVQKVKNSKCMRIRIYQSRISERLGIPTGNRGRLVIKFPKWISSNKSFLVAYLKGLFEAEGSFSMHLPTSTYNLAFTNKNDSLLNIVEKSLTRLGFHPERRLAAVRLRKKQEAFDFEKLISFRKYPKL